MSAQDGIHGTDGITGTQIMIDNAPKVRDTMPMRERMARQMYARSIENVRRMFPVPNESVVLDETWETCGDQMQRHWLTTVDAGLDALMEPTKAMIDVADKTGGLLGGYGYGDEAYCADPREVLRVLVRAAKDGK